MGRKVDTKCGGNLLPSLVLCNACSPQWFVCFFLVPGSILGLQGPDHCMTEHMANQQVWFTTCHDNYVNQWPLLHSTPPYCPSRVSHHWMVRAGGPYQLWSNVFLHRHCCLKPKIGTCWTGHGLITPLGTSSCEYPYFYLLEASKRKQMFLGDTQCPSPHNSLTKLPLSFWGPAFLHANLQKFITSHSPIN